MVKTNNLRDTVAVRNQKKLAKLAKQAPLESSAVNNGRTRFIGGQLVGEAGAQQIWHGDAFFDGDVRITFSLTVGGSTTIGGNTIIGGSVQIVDNLDVSAQTMLRGLTTLMNDLNVLSGGKIVIDGPVPFTLQNGAILFANGTEISGGAFGIRMAGPGSTITAGSSIAGIAAAGNYVTVDSDGVRTGGHLRAEGSFQVVEETILQGPVTFQDAVAYAVGWPTVVGKGLPPGTVWADLDDDNRLYIALS
jgi:NDP-sugar pyrophosphorylase family protein